MHPASRKKNISDTLNTFGINKRNNNHSRA